MYKIILSLILPFCLWLFMQQGILTRQLYLLGDNSQYFYWITYFIEHISRGVYPLWNPFHAWGSTDSFDMLFMGPLNPIYGMMAILISLGVSYYVAFVLIVVLYFWLACLGLYALARVVIGGHWWAWLCYLFILFSCMSNMTFGQLCILLIYVPAVWFFVFLILFVRAELPKQRLVYALALSFCLAMVINSYLPFYFLIIFVSFCLFSLVIAPRWILLAWVAITSFFKQYCLVGVFCFVGVLLACIPSAMWFVESSSKDYVLLVERAVAHSKHAAEIPFQLICLSGVTVWTSFEELFADFNAMNCVSFAPVLLYILVGVVIFNRLRRWQVIVFLMGFLIFLLMLTDSTPLLGFLYKHIYAFHLFRNYFFLSVFAISLFILFLVGQLKEFVSQEIRTPVNTVLRVVFLLVVHVTFFLFLLNISFVPTVSFITIIFSCIWFILLEIGFLKINKEIFVIGLGLILVIQPLVVISSWSFAFAGDRECVQVARNSDVFQYIRPSKGEGINEEHGFHRRKKRNQDESGFVKEGYMGTRDSYELHSHVPSDLLGDYIKYKFILYDNAVQVDFNNPNWDVVGISFRKLVNLAFVDNAKAIGESSMANVKSFAQVIEGPSDSFKVTSFDVNTIQIETNFPTKKFIVYNDSAHSRWQGTIDGHAVPIYKANIAFKGIWVEAGRHVLNLSFYPWWIQQGLFILVIFFFGWMLAVVYLLFKIRKCLDDSAYSS